MSVHPSPLLVRYNGFTLGAFLAASRFPFAQRRYPLHRDRIHEFLAETDIDVALPDDHSVYARHADEIFEGILGRVRDRSEALYDFVGAGAMAVFQGANVALLTREDRRTLQDRWLPVFARYGVAEAYIAWLDNLPPGTETVVAEDLLSPASALLTAALEPLVPEPDTCFVAMPFEPPFTQYYSQFYRPAIERAGLRAIRAWGGLSSEEYYILLLTLIGRSGCLFAELTTINPNVMNEIGVAHGIPRVAFLVGDGSLAELPSNIAHLPNFTYRPSEEDWLPDTIQRCAEFISWMKADFDKRCRGSA